MFEPERRENKPGRWLPSLGFDADSRAPAMAEAVRLGRLSVEHAKSVLSTAQRDVMLQILGVKLAAIEDKTSVDEEKAKENLTRLRLMIANSVKITRVRIK